MTTSSAVRAVSRGSAQRSCNLSRFMGLLPGDARHARKSAEADATAAHRLAVECVVWKPREIPRYRHCAFEPRQRHPGALMRAGAESEVAVRRAADVEVFGVGKLRGIAVGGADAQRDRRARRHRDAAEFDSLHGHAVAELVGALEL